MQEEFEPQNPCDTSGAMLRNPQKRVATMQKRVQKTPERSANEA
jgi:hypothetical protein